MELGRLWLVPLAAALVVAGTVTVMVLRQRYEVPAGYVACPRPDPTYGLGKEGDDCPAPGRFTPKEDIVFLVKLHLGRRWT